ncbi:MAG: hypothetical protein MPK06_03875 [Alphaproteobacteria bacterium]|nr:hypothetical protein [Alphaproteobacteria bacterium]MDA7983672.1 hypothetical protein [Alphaproteobacteria bacterium]MDA7985002.1 hypothetical protein [Alphaproteobacteria bacterium]MDA7987828.1 hypothetical protein [Alphaproteobacteria bacterium]MDA7988199.1 hypothetical protein [Alphaproteobacteria bacterium]
MTQNGDKDSERVWRDPSGRVLDCEDKTKLLDERLAELETLAQDTFADGILIGVDEKQLRASLAQIMERLRNPWRR